MRIITTGVAILVILGATTLISGQLKEIRELKNNQEKLQIIIENQNNEIKAKDKFIDEQQKKRAQIRIVKHIARVKPLDDVTEWLLANCSNGKVC